MLVTSDTPGNGGSQGGGPTMSVNGPPADGQSSTPSSPNSSPKPQSGNASSSGSSSSSSSSSGGSSQGCSDVVPPGSASCSQWKVSAAGFELSKFSCATYLPVAKIAPQRRTVSALIGCSNCNNMVQALAPCSCMRMWPAAASCLNFLGKFSSLSKQSRLRKETSSRLLLTCACFACCRRAGTSAPMTGW
jgi:hypothetical protein